MVETTTLPVDARVEQTLVPPVLPIQRKGGFAKRSPAKEAVFVARGSGDAWSVFVVEGGKAYRRRVELGQRTPFDAEILGGLEEAAQVIVHPSNEITEAMSVTTRSN